MDWNDSKIWLLIGLAGNTLFFSRFMVQWIASERAGQSYMPNAFWWLSIAGSIVLLLYAIHRRDPVFTLAYLPNCIVYVRNLMLIRKRERENAATVAALVSAAPMLNVAQQPHPEAVAHGAASRN